MPKYIYRIRTKTDGQLKTDSIFAESKEEAYQQLLERDFIILSIKLEKERKARFLSFGKVSHLDKLLLARHLAIMIKSGVPLREGIETIKGQSTGKFKEILSDIIKNLENGWSLADSLAIHRNVFGDFFINLVRIGEINGTLDENLEHIYLQLRKSYDLKNKIRTAMIYPVLVLVLAFILIIIVLTFVFPRILVLFKTFDIELPLPTRIFISISGFLQNYGIFLLIFLLILIFISLFLSKFRKVKLVFHKLILNLPLVGRITKNINLAHLSRNLGTLFKGGIPVIETLDITAQTLDNLIYQNQLKKISEAVQEGRQIAIYLKDKPKLFPPTFFSVINIGEKTGKLGDSLLYLGEFYEKEVDDATKRLSDLLEPVLLIIIGLVVAFLAVSIILPIYRFTGQFSQGL